MSKDKKKKKKVKTVYIDDGSTIADMSGVADARPRAFGKLGTSNKSKNNGQNTPVYTGNKFKDSVRTYFKAVRLMIIPMLVTMGIVTAAFLIMWLLLYFA